MIVLYALLLFDGVEGYIYSPQMSFFTLDSCTRFYEVYQDSVLNGILEYSKYSYGSYGIIKEAGCGYVSANKELSPVAPLYIIDEGKTL